jgi:hypothetical protein
MALGSGGRANDVVMDLQERPVPSGARASPLVMLFLARAPTIVLMTEVADREELLVLLSEAARKGRVGAIRILLAELKREEETEPEPQPIPLGILDEIAAKRKG